MKRIKKTLPRISELDFCLELAKGRSKGELVTFEDAYELVFKIREEKEALRSLLFQRLFSPKYRRRLSNKYLKGLVRELLESSKRWGLLKRDELMPNKYFCEKPFERIGQAYKAGNVEAAKEALLTTVYQSEPLFHRFLFLVRDSAPVKVNNIDLEKLEEGVVYSSEHFIREVLDSNPVSFDVACAWGSFFGLTSDYKLALKEKIYRKVFLTCSVASHKELLEALKLSYHDRSLKNALLKKRWSKLKAASTIDCLLALGLINRDSDQPMVRIDELSPEKLIELAHKRGVFSAFQKALSDTVFIVKPEINKEVFKKKLVVTYKQILSESGFYTPMPLWVGELRARTCEELRIPDNVFDVELIRLHKKNPELVWFTGASRVVKRLALKERHKFEKPLIYDDQYFPLVTLIWEGLL